MIACLAPCDLYIDDNVNTLLYAAKAQVISNEPIINDDPKVKKMRELQQHVSSLANQLKQANKAIEFFKNMMDGKAGDNPEIKLDNFIPQISNDQIERDGITRNSKNPSPKRYTNKNTSRDHGDGRSEASGNFYTNR